MAGRDNPGRYHGAPTGNRKEPRWVHEVRSGTSRFVVTASSRFRQRFQAGPRNTGASRMSIDLSRSS